MTLDELNALGDTDAKNAFRSCCGSSRWIDSMIARRPFASKADVLSAADEAAEECTPGDWLEAFSHHPRIGGNAPEREAAEQAGVQVASSSVRAQLEEVNRAYEERFGHIYIVCAIGRSAEEMLSIAQARLGNDAAAELKAAAEEQRKITRLRLGKLIT